MPSMRAGEVTKNSITSKNGNSESVEELNLIKEMLKIEQGYCGNHNTFNRRGNHYGLNKGFSRIWRCDKPN